MKRITILVLLTFAMAISVIGCTKAQSPNTEKASITKTVSLKDVAAKEKDFLSKLNPIRNNINNLYAQFIEGKIDRKKLNTELTILKPQIDQLKAESHEYYKTNKLSSEDKKSSLYTDGLKIGKRVRSNTSSLISAATDGVSTIDPMQKGSDGNVSMTEKQLNDKELKDYFNKKQLTYKERLDILTNAINKI